MRALALVAVVTVVASGVTAAEGCTDHAAASPKVPNDAPSHATAPVATASVRIDAPSGPVRYAVELAVTDAERQKGLMFREHLDDDSGMLFLFEQQRGLSFWMKNTHIPLDMVFIAEDGTIAGIVENAEPLTLSSRKVPAPSRYVLEVNGGATRKAGIAAGQRVHFEGVPANLVDARVLQ
ncbi:MAG TPA: DUF192 domain-containing protein [Myxococcota bacterium]|jgi:hypothetical protein